MNFDFEISRVDYMGNNVHFGTSKDQDLTTYHIYLAIKQGFPPKNDPKISKSVKKFCYKMCLPLPKQSQKYLDLYYTFKINPKSPGLS